MGKYDSPLLLDLFVEWNVDIHGHPPYVKKEDYVKFRALEDEIFAHGMELEEYVRLVIKEYQWLVRKKRWKSLPSNIFLSKKTLRKIFNKKMQGLSLDEDDKHIVLHCEYRYAECVIGTYAAGEEVEDVVTVADKLKLHDIWYTAYAQKDRPIREVATAMKEINGIISNTNNYKEIGKLIHKKRNSK